LCRRRTYAILVEQHMAKSGKDLGGGLSVRVEPRDGGTWVALAGNISEAADLSSLAALRGPLMFDLSGIERINSLGVRNWVFFVDDCERAGIPMTFERCSPVMVQQIGMISSFMGRTSRVRSLIVPYLCPSCNAEGTQLAELVSGKPLAITPTIPCPKCQTPMQIDELPELYETLRERLSAG